MWRAPSLRSGRESLHPISWKKDCAGMGVAEIRRLKQLEDENGKLKRLVADLGLDKEMTSLVRHRSEDDGERRSAKSGEARPSVAARSFASTRRWRWRVRRPPAAAARTDLPPLRWTRLCRRALHVGR